MKLKRLSKSVLLARKLGIYFAQLFSPPSYKANTKPSVPDKRDYVVQSQPETLTESYTIPFLPPIRNQGQINSCRSHTAIRALEIYLLNKGYDFEGSELYHYYMARKHINNTFPRNVGMTMRDGCKVNHKYGSVHEAMFPYELSIATVPHESVHSWAVFLKSSRYERVNTLNDIKVLLQQNIPVQIGIFMDSAYYNLRYTNWVWTPTLRGTKGGHAVIIVGFNSQGFIVDNSWGFWWGRQGQFLIPYDKMAGHTFDWYVDIYNL